jgi:predicted enzyme related to lactoylglutathione lyase
VKSPIENRFGSVFVPVSDMARAIAWYSRVLGLPIQDITHAGKIYNIPMQGDVGLILDGHMEVKNSSQPLFFWWTEDIQQARQFLIENEIRIVKDVEDIGSVSTLTFKDPDGNLLMVCRPNPSK